MSVNFGIGKLIATPNGGDLAANPTPMEFAGLQDVSVEFSSDVKELFGQKQFAIDVAAGKKKVTWKAKFAKINGKQYNDIFFAETLASPMVLFTDEAGTGATTSFTVTNSAKFVEDKGLSYVATGLPLTKVASAPNQGEYSVAAGVYTLGAGDKGTDVLASYTYTAGTGVGTGFTISNHQMGYGVVFQMMLTSSYKGKQLNCQLNACRATKLAMPFKNEEHTVVELDGSAFADDAGNVGKMWFSE